MGIHVNKYYLTVALNHLENKTLVISKANYALTINIPPKMFRMDRLQNNKTHVIPIINKINNISTVISIKPEDTTLIVNYTYCN